MKTLFVSVITLLFTMSCFAQDTLLRFSIQPPGVLYPSYDIGKSPDPEIYPADSIPLFVIKGGGNSKKIRPARILELKTKGNNLWNVIPGYFIKKAFVYGVESMPKKYRKHGTFEVWELYLLKDKAREAFKLLRDKGYIE